MSKFENFYFNENDFFHFVSSQFLPMNKIFYQPFTSYFIEHNSDYKIIKKGKCNILSNYEMNSILQMNINFIPITPSHLLIIILKCQKKKFSKKHANIKLFEIKIKDYKGNHANKNNITHELFQHAIEYCRNMFDNTFNKIDKKSIIIEIFYDY